MIEWESTNTNNTNQILVSDGVLDVKFQYLPEIQNDPLMFSYTDSNTELTTSFNLKLITALSASLDFNTKKMNIVLINIPNPQSVNASDF